MSAIYKAITLDGQEHEDVDLETLKEWYFARRLRADSFVLSPETGEWKLLKNLFDPAEWEAEARGARGLQPDESVFAEPTAPRPRWEPAAMPLIPHQDEVPKKRGSGKAIGLLVVILAICAIAGVVKVKRLSPENLRAREIRKYALPTRSYGDRFSGTRMDLPDGWVMLPLVNPFVPEPEADMIAAHPESNSYATLMLVRHAKTIIELDEALSMVVKGLQEQYATMVEVERSDSSFGKLDARKAVLTWTFNGRNMKGAMTVTRNGANYLFLHEWCAEESYEKSLLEFAALEKGASAYEPIREPTSWNEFIPPRSAIRGPSN